MNGFRIFKTTDLIEVKIDGISFYVNPMTYQQKCVLQPLMFKAAQGDMRAAMDAVIQSIKFTLKKVKGLKLDEDTEYKLEIENGEVTDSCLDDLMNLPMSSKLSSLCSSLINGISTGGIKSPSGETIEGIEFVGKVKDEEKK